MNFTLAKYSRALSVAGSDDCKRLPIPELVSSPEDSVAVAYSYTEAKSAPLPM